MYHRPDRYDYLVLESDHPLMLAEQIAASQSEGWRCVGDVTIAFQRFFQAMVRERRAG